jgi:hypothetical protein
LTGVVEPRGRGAKVVVVGLQQTHRWIATPLGDSEVVVGVSLSGGVELGVLAETLQSVLPDGFEHPVARLIIGVPALAKKTFFYKRLELVG